MFSTLSAYRTLIILTVIMASACPALAAEKVWDNELRRYLKDDDFKYEEFMTEEEAVKTILPKSQRVRKEIIRLTQTRRNSSNTASAGNFLKTRLISISERQEIRSMGMQ